ncbi:MAG: hypothetical protein D3923_04105 [Candidatus Electrothrix sp. AR3]|nr:hypothetical protein [Candidatus Electrothrix sp. AR3]
MHGNVREWCQDWYGDYPEEAVIDPTGPVTGYSHTNRGGSWAYNSWFCRSADRSWYGPNSRQNMLGFRLARSRSGKP